MPQAYDPFDSDTGDSDSTGDRDATRRTTSRHFERLLEQLVAGDRLGCRDTLRDALDRGAEASEVLRTMIWPACAMIDTLARRDQIAPVHEHCATMLLTQLAQRLECGLPKSPARGRTVVVTSGPKPTEELAAEIFAGLAEADGFEVLFLGGGVESDDLFAEVGRRRPSFVISFAAGGPDAPRLRRFIDAVRAQSPVPGLLIGAGGGVFARAPGLADEIGADFTADTPFEMLQALQALSRKGTGPAVRRAKAA